MGASQETFLLKDLVVPLLPFLTGLKVSGLTLLRMRRFTVRQTTRVRKAARVRS
jgi:hypothetical protein